MSEQDRERWEAKHAGNAGSALGPPVASVEWLPDAGPQGLALDLACGAGRHCKALLSRGYRVIAADVSATALRRLMSDHRQSAASIMPVHTDLDHWVFAPRAFDLVVQCDFLDRRLFAPIRDSVREGGHVLIDTFCGAGGHGPGPSCRDYRLEEGELLRVFASWEIVRHGSAAPGRDAILARKNPRR